MKKLCALLIACSTITAVMSGCGKDGKKSSKDIDSKLIGSWYSDEIGGNLSFSEDKKVSLSIDYSSIIHFNEDQKLEFSGITCDSEYDGKTLSATVDAGSETMEVLTIERIGKEDEDSIDGEYDLKGGELYSELQGIFDSETSSTLYVVVDGEDFDIKVNLCEYKADGKKVELIGEGVEIFDFEDDDEAVLTYEIDGDKLTLTESGGNTIELKKQDK